MYLCATLLFLYLCERNFVICIASFGHFLTTFYRQLLIPKANRIFGNVESVFCNAKGGSCLIKLKPIGMRVSFREMHG